MTTKLVSQKMCICTKGVRSLKFFTPLLLRLNILRLWNILSFGIRLLLKLQGECSKLLAVSERHSITHNSWTDRARKPVKTSLDPWDSKESNENDKNIPLHVKFLKKIHVCAFAVLNYWQNSVRMEKTFPAYRLVYPIRFFASPTTGILEKQDPVEKSLFGPLWGEIWGAKL